MFRIEVCCQTTSHPNEWDSKSYNNVSEANAKIARLDKNILQVIEVEYDFIDINKFKEYINDKTDSSEFSELSSLDLTPLDDTPSLESIKLFRINIQLTAHLFDFVIKKRFKKIDLSNCNLSDDHAKALSTYITETNTLEIFCASNNPNISSRGVQFLANALKINRTVRDVILFYVPSNNETVEIFVDVIKENPILKSLKISVELSTVKPMWPQRLAEVLKNSHTFTHLSLWSYPCKERRNLTHLTKKDINAFYQVILRSKTLQDFSINELLLDGDALSLQISQKWDSCLAENNKKPENNKKSSY